MSEEGGSVLIGSIGAEAWEAFKVHAVVSTVVSWAYTVSHPTYPINDP